jgi:MFS family permease
MYSGLQKIFGPNYSLYHNLLFSVYALPNLLLPLLFSLSGGSESSKLFFTYSLILIGQAVTSLGIFMEVFECVIAGRFIIGLGGESFSIALNKILASLFSPSEHGRVFGLSVAIGRLGSILAQLLLGYFIHRGALFCSLLVIGALLSGIIVNILKYVSTDNYFNKGSANATDTAGEGATGNTTDSTTGNSTGTEGTTEGPIQAGIDRIIQENFLTRRTNPERQ